MTPKEAADVRICEAQALMNTILNDRGLTLYSHPGLFGRLEAVRQSMNLAAEAIKLINEEACDADELSEASSTVTAIHGIEQSF